MTFLSRTRRTAAEALGLRAWALARLFRGSANSPPAASPDAWRLFLRWERCALLVEDALGGEVDTLPAAVGAELRTRALRETMRILSARAQLQTVAEIAGEQGLRVAALKGTADVARGRDILGMDVDIIAPPEDARRLAHALDARGFSPKQYDGAWHLQPRTQDGALQIEIHTAVTGFDASDSVPWRDTRPLPGFDPLVAFAPHDHAWTVLSQAVRKHPDRRTRIRDLYMVRLALAECTEAERKILEERASADPFAHAFLEMLAHAESGGADEASPYLNRRLPRSYLLQARVARVPESGLLGTLWRVGIDTTAIGQAQNKRRLVRLRADSGRRGWSRGRLLRGPALLTAAAGAALLTLDAALLRGPIPSNEPFPSVGMPGE